MIRKCKPQDESMILKYIGEDYSACLYLYMNLKRYGLNSPIINVYVQFIGDVITAVLLQYYSCLHVYSNNDSFDAKEIADFFDDGEYTMLYCTKRTADRILQFFDKELKAKLKATTGWVAQIKSVDKKAEGLAVIASRDDFYQIAKLIYQDDDIGKSYNYESLTRQLEERNQEGYARNLVIKADNIVVVHACTNAEIDNIAVVAELVVREEYRRKGYASEIWRDLCGRLLSEGKAVFSFYYSQESRMLHEKIGFSEICEWEKIVKN